MPNPPKPTERKRKAGNPGKRRLPEPTALVLATAMPSAPQDLGKAGLVVWRRAWDAGSDWLAPGDVTLVELLCHQFDEIVRWQALVDVEGVTFTTNGGMVRVHPGVAQIRELEQRVVTNLGLLGFSPADRARLGLTEVRKLSGLAELAQRRQREIGR